MARRALTHQGLCRSATLAHYGSVRDDDPVLDALDELLTAGRENVTAWMKIMARVEDVRDLRRRGTAYRDMGIADGIPIIDAISSNQERLTAAAARFRRAAAHQLVAEGMTPAEIARVFGVSRQRVSVLLGESANTDGPVATDIDDANAGVAQIDRSDSP